MSNIEIPPEWVPSAIGCHWTRTLPDGTTQRLSTWATGVNPRHKSYVPVAHGYSLTVNRQTTKYPDAGTALAAADDLAGATQ